ncbi:hypothetical protein ACFQEX_00415 [Roseibium salinum]|uniref:hypothetical protein n=1 Tax=Roseibium salinum TaxID=1604349 RepID=UPI0036063371
MTRIMCNSLYQGEYSLAEVAPKGFVIARGDIHYFGFSIDPWKKNWYAVTITGDSEMDAAAGHPAWAFQYDSDGNLVSCAVDIGPKTSEKEDIPSDDLGAEAVQFIHIALPQMFTAIITEPPVSVPLLIGPSGAISLATPCGEKWCRISTLYDFRPGEWHLSLTVRFDEPPEWN